MSSVQTKRAVYLTKTPFQLDDILSLHRESDSCDRSGVGMFSCEKLSRKPRVFVFRFEGKILMALFCQHMFFHLATEK